MVDIQKIEKGLETCNSIEHPCNECPYLSERNCSLSMVRDALELIKHQQEKLEEAKRWLLADGVDLDAMFGEKDCTPLHQES